MPPRKRLGQLLTELGVIDEHQLQSALGHQKQWGGKLGGILVQKGFCTEDAMVDTLAKHLGMQRVKIAEAKIDPRALKTVSKQIAEKLHVFPYEISGSGRSEVVTIAMSDPTDLSAVDQLAFHTGKRIKPMLAGDSEVLSAIQTHYGTSEEKKEPTDKLAKPQAQAAPAAAAAAAGAFPRRIDPIPAAAAAGAARAAPYMPPPIPAGKAPPAQKLEEIEPDEVMAPPAATTPAAPAAPVDLPEDDAEDFGLEPIAAHSQFGDQVAGQEEFGGEGSAGDKMEGLVSASAAELAAQQPSDWEAPAKAADQGWGEPAPTAGWEQAAPAAPEAAGWGSAEAAPAVDWGETSNQEAAPQAAADDWSALAEPQATEPPSEQLPADAILGAAGETPEAEAAAATGWDAPAEASAAEQAAAEEPAPAPEIAASAEEPAPAEAETGTEEELDDPVPIDEDFDTPQEPAAEEPAPEPLAAAAEPPPQDVELPQEPEPPPPVPPEPEPAQEIEAAAQEPEPPREVEAPAHEAEAPDAWAATDDPLAAQGGDTPAWGEVPQEGSADHASGQSATQEFANPVALQEPEAQEQAPMESAAEETATETAFAESEPPPDEGVAPPEPESYDAPAEPQATAWMGESLEPPPLSRADHFALASIGVDPGDGVGALRLLAALVRILNRHQVIDPEELAAEIRESREQAAAAIADAPRNGAEAEHEPASTEASPEPAET